MPAYPGSETERRVPFDPLLEVITGVFAACGMPREDAALVADTLVSCDLRGVHSHGLIRLPDYLSRFVPGGINPNASPRIVTELGGAIRIDGDNGMGQVVGVFAMNEAIERAKTHGVAIAAVGGSNHCGAMAYYTEMAVKADMIGLATTNALPTMAPWGGTTKIVGINPLSIGIPAGEAKPVIMDLAFGGSAHGKLRVYAQKGLPIPDGWALDKHGQPTNDAQAAVDGLIAPIGQFKGMNLGMTMGMLATLMSGAGYGTELGNMVDGPNFGVDGQFYMAINAGALEDIDTLKARTDKIVAEIHASPVAEGHDRVYAPGEIEALTAEQYLRDGIPLNEETLAGILDEAGARGVDTSPLGLS